MRTSYLFSIISILFIGCGSNGGDSSSLGLKQANSLTISDFIVAPIGLSSSTFEKELNENDNFFLNEPENGANSSAEEECLSEKLLDATSQYKIKKDIDNTFYFNLPSLNVSECFPPPISGVPVTMYMSLYANKLLYQNESNTIVDIEGYTLNELEDLTIIQERTIRSIYITATKSDQSFSVITYAALTGSDGYNSICSYANPIKCIDREVSTYYENSELDYSDETVLTTNVNYTNKSDRYFSSGTIEFIMNDWNGVMTYTDGYEPPKYVASSKTALTSSGVFEYSKFNSPQLRGIETFKQEFKNIHNSFKIEVKNLGTSILRR